MTRAAMGRKKESPRVTCMGNKHKPIIRKQPFSRIVKGRIDIQKTTKSAWWPKNTSPSHHSTPSFSTARPTRFRGETPCSVMTAGRALGREVPVSVVCGPNKQIGSALSGKVACSCSDRVDGPLVDAADIKSEPNCQSERRTDFLCDPNRPSGVVGLDNSQSEGRQRRTSSERTGEGTMQTKIRPAIGMWRQQTHA